MRSSIKEKNYVTTQRTSKPLKVQLLLSSALFWFALLSWFLPYGHSAEVAGVSWAAFATTSGAVWYTVTMCFVWWHHE